MRLWTVSWLSWRRYENNENKNLLVVICTCSQTLFFLCLCLQVESTAEGEAQRYFDHALTLKNTILFLRYNKELTQDQGPDIPNIGNYTLTPSLSLPSWICKIKMCMSVHVVNKQLGGQVGFCVFHLVR